MAEEQEPDQSVCEEEEEDRLMDLNSKEQERLRAVYEAFVDAATPDQLNRFDHWRRSRFPRAAVKRLMVNSLGTSSDKGAIILATVAKAFVGDLVEGARERMIAMGESGPILPIHLRQAHRRWQNSKARALRRSPRLNWRTDCGA